MSRLQLFSLILVFAIEATTSWQPNSQHVHTVHKSTRITTSALSASNLGDNPELAFVPKKVLSKFLSSVGGPIASSSLQAGYQAGAVTEEELENVKANLEHMDNTELMDDAAIEQKWKEALLNEPWHIKSMGNMASGLVVGIVSTLQIKLQDQAEQMKWINDNALPIIQANQTVVDLLGGSPIAFNNTRARYEPERDGNIWSASMDVLGLSVADDNDSAVGLVNAYFTPSQDIKILVVEIDDVMHNLTWKGLP